VWWGEIGREFWHEITSEDVDFSLRILKAGFRLYYQPSAVVDHMHRVTLAAYCTQLYGYGFGHPLAVQKHAKNVLEIQLQYTPRYLTLVIPFPKKGIIYIGDFHFMHLFGALFLGALIRGAMAGACAAVPTAVFGGLFAIFLFRYFSPMLKLKPLGKVLTFCRIRYVSNWALMKGGFKGSATFGPIYLESSW